MTKETFINKWKPLYFGKDFISDLTKVMNDFAKEKCREQKKICVTYVDCYEAEHDLYPDLNNAPLPRFDENENN